MDILEDLLKGEEVIEKVRDVVEALSTFNEVRTAYFGQTLDPDYKTYITSFADAYVKLGIDVTPKLHAVLVHVLHILDQNPGHGLGSLVRTGVRISTL